MQEQKIYNTVLDEIKSEGWWGSEKPCGKRGGRAPSEQGFVILTFMF